MAISRARVGSTVRLWPADLNSRWVSVLAPNGQEWRIKRSDEAVEIPLTQVGEWSYEWSDADKGTIEVVNAPPVTRTPEAKLPTRWELK